MAEITELGYEDLRYHVQETWTRIVLKDDVGEEVRNLPLTNETVSWIHPTKSKQIGWDNLGNPINADVPDTDTLQLQIVVKGTDSGITLPTTFASSEIHNDNGEQMTSTETFETFSMTQEDDEITVIHSVEVPKVTI